jgi:hypothetical protein
MQGKIVAVIDGDQVTVEALPAEPDDDQTDLEWARTVVYEALRELTPSIKKLVYDFSEAYDCNNIDAAKKIHMELEACLGRDHLAVARQRFFLDDLEQGY